MKKTETNWLLAAVIGAGAFVAWKAWGAAGSLVSAATAPLANWYVYLSSQGAPVPQGLVVFPDFSTIPAAQLPPIAWYGNAATFVYNGGNWQLLSHDANGNYPAVPYVGG